MYPVPDGPRTTIGVSAVRELQERLFQLRDETALELRESSRLLELAALGGSNQANQLLAVSKRVADLSLRLKELATRIGMHVHFA